MCLYANEAKGYISIDLGRAAPGSRTADSSAPLQTSCFTYPSGLPSPRVTTSIPSPRRLMESDRVEGVSDGWMGGCQRERVGISCGPCSPTEDNVKEADYGNLVVNLINYSSSTV